MAGSLPKALNNLGLDIRVATPLFLETKEKFGKDLVRKLDLVVHFGDPKEAEKVTVWETRFPGSETTVLFFENEKYLSHYVSSTDFGDEQKIVNRFLFFSAAVVSFLKETGLSSWDIVHLNDWHTAMIATLLRADLKGGEVERIPKILFTIHNLSYKGRGVADVLDWFGGEVYGLETVEWDIGNGTLNALKQGIVNSDFISAVSPSYALEIQTKEYGEGLDEILKAREGRIEGILNGIDAEFWNPRTDNFLEANYDFSDWEKGKGENKGILLSRITNHESRIMNSVVFGMVTRLTSQKGVDIVVEAMREMLSKMVNGKWQMAREGYSSNEQSTESRVQSLKKPVVARSETTPRVGSGQAPQSLRGTGEIAALPSVVRNDKEIDVKFVVLGTGEKGLEEKVTALANEFPENVFVKLGFDEALAHLIYAGSDFFLVPSRFEPCGLTQMIAMRYGSVPIVRKTGGLADTVTDKETGYVFEDYSSEALYRKLHEATEAYLNNFEGHRRLVENGMKKDFSWEKSAKEYLELYKKMVSL